MRRELSLESWQGKRGRRKLPPSRAVHQQRWPVAGGHAQAMLLTAAPPPGRRYSSGTSFHNQRGLHIVAAIHKQDVMAAARGVVVERQRQRQRG